MVSPAPIRPETRATRTAGCSTQLHRFGRHARRDDYLRGTRPVGEIEKVVKGATVKTTTNALLVDALGSIDTIYTSSGAKPIKYDPFGTRVEVTIWTVPITAPPQDLRAGFTGHDHDDDVDLIDMIVSRTSGGAAFPRRSTSVAPASKIDSQAYNPYAYVRNNLLNATDPTGYLEIDLMGLPWKWNDNITYGSAAWSSGGGGSYVTWGGGIARRDLSRHEWNGRTGCLAGWMDRHLG